MPKPILWFLQGLAFTVFWLLVDRRIKIKNVVEAYDGFASDYIEDFKTYGIARNAYDDASSRHDRIHSKLMFTAQLQGLILMSLALHSVVNYSGDTSYDVYLVIALLFNFLGVMMTLYALSVKAVVVFDYSKFSGENEIKNEEKEEFNEVISKMHDRCDFLADMYKIIITFFAFSFIATIIDLLPIPFLKSDNGLILILLVGIWFIYKMISAAFLVDVKEKLRNDEIDE